jgi:hypothetical protein
MSNRSTALYGLSAGIALTLVAALYAADAQPQQAPANKRPSQDLYKLVKGMYDRLDTTGKGYITRNDIDRAFMNHAIKGREAQALYVLRSNFGDFAHTPKPGKVANVSEKVARITLADLEQFDKTLKPDRLSYTIDDQMETAEKFLSRVNRKLYAAGAEADSLAKMRGIGQVGRGNCYLLSGYSAAAALDPASVRKMIKENKPDARGVRTFTVTFPRAPGEEYVVDDLSDAALLINEVQEDTGIWAAVLVRAYGEYLKAHPRTRLFERYWHKLDERELAEDMTDEGSMNHEGLRMMTDPETTWVLQVVWDVDPNNLKPFFGDFAPIVVKLAQPFLNTRDPALLAAKLKESICDNKLPATVLKYGGAHEAAIVSFVPGTKTADGKHTSKYGFVTVRDQAGLSDEEQKSIKGGASWRDKDADDKTISMSAEEFARMYSGFACVLKR